MRILRMTLAATMVWALAACGDRGAGGLAGKWSKSMAGEGDVTMNVGAGGKATVELPSPRWPEEHDVTATIAIAGDSLAISDEGGPAACGKDKPAPRYAAKLEGKSLMISGGSGDPCPARHAVLIGTWTKE
jgi:hypothetical protein